MKVTFVTDFHIIIPYPDWLVTISISCINDWTRLQMNILLMYSVIFQGISNIPANHNRNATVSAEKNMGFHKPPKHILDSESQRVYDFKVDLFSTYKLHLYIFNCDLILYKSKRFTGSDFLLMFWFHFIDILVPALQSVHSKLEKCLACTFGVLVEM